MTFYFAHQLFNENRHNFRQYARWNKSKNSDILYYIFPAYLGPLGPAFFQKNRRIEPASQEKVHAGIS